MTYNRYLYVKSTKSKHNVWIIVLVILFSLFLFYCNIRPNDTGILGRSISNIMQKIFGITRFFVPMILLYWIWYVLKSKTKQLRNDILLTILFILLLSGTTKIILRIIKLPYEKVNIYSGLLGNSVVEIFERIFGTVFGSVLIVILLVFVITVLFEISIVEIGISLYENIISDIKDWYSEIKKKKKETIQQNVSPLPSRYVQQRNVVEKQIVQEQIKVEKKEYEIKKQPVQPTKTLVEEEQKVVETKPKQQKVVQVKQQYKLPSTELLSFYDQETQQDTSFLEECAKRLENVLKEFDIQAKVVNVSTGPVVTLYELELEPGVKVQTVSSLRDNIALAMKASSIRIIAPMPSKGTIGIEIPNPKPQIVSIREVLESKEYKEATKHMKLPIVLGKTVEGQVYVDDIVPMPHILIAGATGSGKSVCIHSMIMSLLFKCPPDYLKLLLIDPKRLELMYYDGIPHLYNPNCPAEEVKVITSSKEAAKVLTSLVKVMEQRYEKFASACVRNIEGYNELMASRGEPQEYFIVVIIDEFADLILTVPHEVEDAIQRLAQMARAVGIHLVLATQRPSVDVITGVIKANFSCRIAFQVLSKTDSRVILDITGAEELLGRGDMLYLPTGAPKPIRLQGAYVSEKDINNVVNFIKSQNIKPNYEPILKQQLPHKESKEVEQKESLYEALVLIRERRRVSQDLLKAYFRSSSKATDILSLLEVKGFIYKPEGTNRWSINFDKVEEAIKNYETYKTFEVKDTTDNN